MTTGVCAECGKRQRLTKAGLVYKHGDCYGGGEHPVVHNTTGLEGSGEPVENFNNSTVGASSYVDPMASFTPEAVVKTGYTAEDLHEMLWNLTPKRKKLRERVRGFFDNLRNYFNGAWDAYDDE